GQRLVVSFLLLNDAETAPAQNDAGEDLYAVTICNANPGTNPTSKSYRIRKAMLAECEYDPIEAAKSVPPWDHFEAPLKSKRRTLRVRVRRKVDETTGNAVSLVTHIQRPRDSVWEWIEQEAPGKRKGTKARFWWLNADGSVAPYVEDVNRMKSDFPG